MIVASSHCRSMSMIKSEGLLDTAASIASIIKRSPHESDSRSNATLGYNDAEMNTRENDVDIDMASATYAFRQSYPDDASAATGNTRHSAHDHIFAVMCSRAYPKSSLSALRGIKHQSNLAESCCNRQQKPGEELARRGNLRLQPLSWKWHSKADF